MGLRVHVAITDRGQRLDRKIKKSERFVAGDIGDRLVAEPIKKCERRIENDEDDRGRGEEARPSDRHRAMVEIGPETVGEPAGFDFAAAYSNEVPAAFACEIDLFRKFRQSGQVLKNDRTKLNHST
jgi:hypothetical protein